MDLFYDGLIKMFKRIIRKLLYLFYEFISLLGGVIYFKYYFFIVFILNNVFIKIN